MQSVLVQVLVMTGFLNLDFIPNEESFFPQPSKALLSLNNPSQHTLFWENH